MNMGTYLQTISKTDYTDIGLTSMELTRFRIQILWRGIKYLHVENITHLYYLQSLNVQSPGITLTYRNMLPQ